VGEAAPTKPCEVNFVEGRLSDVSSRLWKKVPVPTPPPPPLRAKKSTGKEEEVGHDKVNPIQGFKVETLLPIPNPLPNNAKKTVNKEDMGSEDPSEADSVESQSTASEARPPIKSKVAAKLACGEEVKPMSSGEVESEDSHSRNASNMEVEARGTTRLSRNADPWLPARETWEWTWECTPPKPKYESKVYRSQSWYHGWGHGSGWNARESSWVKSNKSNKYSNYPKTSREAAW